MPINKKLTNPTTMLPLTYQLCMYRLNVRDHQNRIEPGRPLVLHVLGVLRVQQCVEWQASELNSSRLLFLEPRHICRRALSHVICDRIFHCGVSANPWFAVPTAVVLTGTVIDMAVGQQNILRQQPPAGKGGCDGSQCKLGDADNNDERDCAFRCG